MTEEAAGQGVLSGSGGAAEAVALSSPLRSRAVRLSMLSLAVVWIWLCQVVPVVGQGGAGHDDALFVRLASSISNGHWLGSYDELTLAKGCGYPLFPGVCTALGVPAPFAQRSLHVAAAAVVVWALGPLLRRRGVAILSLAVLLAQPLPWPWFAREAIYPDLALATMAVVVGLVLRAEESPRRLVGPAAALGLTLGMLWITREEGVWIAPAVLLALAVILGTWIHRLRPAFGGLGHRAVVLLPAPAAFAAVPLAVRAANLLHYGVFTAVEVTSAPFTSAFGALSRVEHPGRRRFVPVPRDVREAVYRVSPSFRKLRSELEGGVGASWGEISCATLPSTCGDIAGGWFQWALRDAAARTGHHRTATLARDLYRGIADEVNGAWRP